MVCRPTLWHCCARACFYLICCSVALASCCSGRVSSQYLTSMRCTSWWSQREGCIACMSLCSWWPFFVPTAVPAGSLQIASGLEQDQSSSAERFGRSHRGKVLLATCAGKTKIGWAIRVSLPISVKLMLPPNSPFIKGFDDEPGSNVMSFSHHVLNWSILTTRKHMDLAVWLMTQQTRCTSGSAVEVGHFLSVKSTRS